VSPSGAVGLTPEQKARAEIDRLLTAAGWTVCDSKQANIHASRGVAIRNFTLADGYGFADYLLYVDAKAAGVIEAKRQGATLSGARRVLFLVDRGNLGRQAKKEFDQYVSPYNNFKFGEEYIIQHLTSNNLDKTARATICTIQRLFSMLKGRELAEEDEERSTAGVDSLFKETEPIDYNPASNTEWLWTGRGGFMC
jgi:type I site-specific restriction endonuclease